jgi:predicted membrane protein
MEKSKKFETLLVIIAGLLVFYFIFKINALLFISLGIAIIAITSDYLTEKIAWAWMKLAQLLGLINGKILLSIIFFLFLTPIAFLYKLKGKNNLNLKKNKPSDSYYSLRNHEYSKEDLENIW